MRRCSDWRAQEGQVRRLRQRIFTAAQEQDWPKVRNLQKLMLRSRANTLVSVRQVTQRNAGRRTAGGVSGLSICTQDHDQRQRSLADASGLFSADKPCARPSAATIRAMQPGC